MRSKLLIATAMAVTGVLVLAAMAIAGAAAPTTLTIRGQDGDYHGRIDSPRLHRCVDGRLVKVYKQQGTEQQPRDDLKIGQDNAEIRNDHGVWSIGNSGFRHGKFYARAPKTEGCRAGHSDTITR